MSKTTFRTWHNTLFLGPMPGTEAPLQDWLDVPNEAGISAVVCLNPDDEIGLLSPEYRDWRRDQAPHSPMSRFDVPIDDGCAPTGAAVLMKLGYSLVDAATEMYEVGSYPETPAQDAFLEERDRQQ